MKKCTLILTLAVAACGEAPVEPEPLYPASVTISAEDVVLAKKGEGPTLTATVFDQHGDTLDAEVLWSSTDTTVASVGSRSGVVHARATGVGEIVATAEDVADSVPVSVNFERGALKEIYEALGGPNWRVNDGWGTDADLGEWHGVTTDGQGRVVAIVLQSNGLEGDLPVDAILGLGHLRSLDLSFNEEVTGTFPAEFARMTKLRELNLHHNGLEGTFPVEWLAMELVTLNIHHNKLTGTLPESLGDMTTLELFDVWGNSDLTGPLPESIGDLENLRWLGLNVTKLAGRLPRSMLNLDLEVFNWFLTDLCAPTDDEFQTWLDAIPVHRDGDDCEDD